MPNTRKNLNLSGSKIDITTCGQILLQTFLNKCIVPKEGINKNTSQIFQVCFLETFLYLYL